MRIRFGLVRLMARGGREGYVGSVGLVHVGMHLLGQRLSGGSVKSGLGQV